MWDAGVPPREMWDVVDHLYKHTTPVRVCLAYTKFRQSIGQTMWA